MYRARGEVGEGGFVGVRRRADGLLVHEREEEVVCRSVHVSSSPVDKSPFSRQQLAPPRQLRDQRVVFAQETS